MDDVTLNASKLTTLVSANSKQLSSQQAALAGIRTGLDDVTHSAAQINATVSANARQVATLQTSVMFYAYRSSGGFTLSSARGACTTKGQV